MLRQSCLRLYFSLRWLVNGLCASAGGPIKPRVSKCPHALTNVLSFGTAATASFTNCLCAASAVHPDPQAPTLRPLAGRRAYLIRRNIRSRFDRLTPTTPTRSDLPGATSTIPDMIRMPSGKFVRAPAFSVGIPTATGTQSPARFRLRAWLSGYGAAAPNEVTRRPPAPSSWCCC
jgi:hypothetical protein